MTEAVARRVERARAEQAAWAWWVADFAAERGFASARGQRRESRAVMSHRRGCPRQAFPVGKNGHRDWQAGLELVEDGLGLTATELVAVDVDGVLPGAGAAGEPSGHRRELSAGGPDAMAGG